MKNYKYFLLLFFILSAMPVFANQTLRLDNGKAFVISDDFQKSDQMSTKAAVAYYTEDKQAFIQTLNLGDGFDITLEELQQHCDEVTNSFISGVEGGGGSCENLTKVVSQTKSGSPILILNYDLVNTSGLKIATTTYILFINGRMNAVSCGCLKETLRKYAVEFSKVGAQIYNF